MLLKYLFSLFAAWGLLFTSEKAFPKVNRILGTEADWGSLFLFKPFHLLVSVFCFISAFLIFRHLFRTCLKNLFSRGPWFRKARLINIILIGLIGWIVIELTIKYSVPTLFLIGMLVAFDLLRWFSMARRNRRLKTALQELKP
ncbi:hypothetical protein [Ammoniphilus sp. 3BR4]|uniref:hypothetical protein n=1 Tax=Ammoniphilus sp. 3BR4 TaxID=3158265 RepID=UPI003467C590